MSIESVLSKVKDSVDDSNRFIIDLEDQIESVLKQAEEDIQELNEKIDELEESVNDLFLENKYLQSKIIQLELDVVEAVITNKRYELDI